MEHMGEEIRVGSISSQASFGDRGLPAPYSSTPIILDAVPSSRRRSSSTSSESVAPEIELKLGWGRRRRRDREWYGEVLATSVMEVERRACSRQIQALLYNLFAPANR